MRQSSHQFDRPIYDSGRQYWPVIDELARVIGYRYVVAQLVARNIRMRYKRSVLGIAWTVLNPLMMITVLSIVFSHLFQSSVPDYVAYVVTGIVFWTFFAQTTTSIMNSLIWGGNLIGRLYLPRAAFGLAALGAGIVNLLLSFAPLLVILLLFGVSFGPSVLFFPFALLVVSMFILGFGLILSVFAVFFPDTVEIYQVFLIAWMYLTPVFYPIEIIPEHSRWLFGLNPAYHLLELFRTPIHSGRLPSIESVLIACLIAVVTLVVGWCFFAVKADEIAYRV